MSAMEYFASESIIHRLDARVKIVLLFLLTILVFITRELWILAILFTFIIGCWVAAKIPIKKLLNYFKLLSGLIIFLIIIQALMQPGETYLVKPIFPAFIPWIGGMGKITMEGVFWGVLLGFRILVIMSLMPLVIMTTRIRDFSLALVKLGMPYTVAYMITTALNHVPTIRNEIQTIMDAQKLRAFDVFEEGSFIAKFRAYPALVVPLVIGSMRKSMLVGVAMDMRAFGSKTTRSYVRDFTMGRADWLFLVTIITMFIVLLASNFAF